MFACGVVRWTAQERDVYSPEMTSLRPVDLPCFCWADKHAAKMVVATINEDCFDHRTASCNALLPPVPDTPARRSFIQLPAIAKGGSEHSKTPEKNMKNQSRVAQRVHPASGGRPFRDSATPVAGGARQEPPPREKAHAVGSPAYWRGTTAGKSPLGSDLPSVKATARTIVFLSETAIQRKEPVGCRPPHSG